MPGQLQIHQEKNFQFQWESHPIREIRIRTYSRSLAILQISRGKFFHFTRTVAPVETGWNDISYLIKFEKNPVTNQLSSGNQFKLEGKIYSSS